MKKFLLGAGVIAVALMTLPLFAAFEAHVVNVTAVIENALSVPLENEGLDFGTVFPQEVLAQQLGVSLSRSFLDEDRVDDVGYFIRQKPKCGITSENGTVLDEDSTRTGHVNVDENGNVTIDCGDAPRDLEEGEDWGVLPMLCPYISKHADGQPANDESLNSFHQPFEVVLDDNGTEDPSDDFYKIVWNDTDGRLAKSEQDVEDNWTIDLAVPCFRDEDTNQCAQDWEDFVHRHNPDANADEYVQPTENEHKVFGCDLWVEVSEVSEFED